MCQCKSACWRYKDRIVPEIKDDRMKGHLHVYSPLSEISNHGVPGIEAGRGLCDGAYHLMAAGR